MATYHELMAQKAAIDAAVAKAREVEAGAVIETIRKLMAEYQLTLSDIRGNRGPGRPLGSKNKDREPPPPRFLNPSTGETWSGRGRAPGWAGHSPERYLIGAQAA